MLTLLFFAISYPPIFAAPAALGARLPNTRKRKKLNFDPDSRSYHRRAGAAGGSEYILSSIQRARKSPVASLLSPIQKLEGSVVNFRVAHDPGTIGA